MFILRYVFVACLVSVIWAINGWSEDDKTLELKKIVVTAPKTKTPLERLPVVPVDISLSVSSTEFVGIIAPTARGKPRF